MAQQGHLYEHLGEKVLAMGTSDFLVMVRVVYKDSPWLGESRRVRVGELTAVPMRYFKGQIPKGGHHG